MTVLSPKAKNPTLQGFSDTTSPAFRQNCSKSGTHSIWLRGPDLNRRPSGYEGVIRSENPYNLYNKYCFIEEKVQNTERLYNW